MEDVKQFFNNNELSIDIWTKKYKRPEDTSLEKWLDRVSGDNKYIKELIREKRFIFAGRTLANRGLEVGSYSNCYSRGFVEDDLIDIMKANSDIALTYKAQGGQGLSLSKIRPKGAKIANGYESDGIVPFMKLYNETTRAISQGG